MKEGIGSLLDTALSVFPLESGPPLQLLTSLATADRRSAGKVRAPPDHAQIAGCLVLRGRVRLTMSDNKQN